MIISVIKKKLTNMSFPLLGRGLALPSLGLFGPSFSWVGVGLLSRVTVGLLGFEVGVVPFSLGLGLSSFVWFFIHDSHKNHTMTIISEGGGK